MFVLIGSDAGLASYTLMFRRGRDGGSGKRVQEKLDLVRAHSCLIQRDSQGSAYLTNTFFPPQSVEPRCRRLGV